MTGYRPLSHYNLQYHTSWKLLFLHPEIKNKQGYLFLSYLSNLKQRTLDSVIKQEKNSRLVKGITTCFDHLCIKSKRKIRKKNLPHPINEFSNISDHHNKIQTNYILTNIKGKVGIEKVKSSTI